MKPSVPPAAEAKPTDVGPDLLELQSVAIMMMGSLPPETVDEDVLGQFAPDGALALVKAIQRLGERARSGQGEAAMGALVLVTMAAYIEHERFVQACRGQAEKLYSKSLMVPSGSSPIPAIRRIFQDSINDLRPGTALYTSEIKAKLKLDLEANSLAFAVFQLMVQFRNGYALEPCAPDGWVERCRKLKDVATDAGGWKQAAGIYVIHRYAQPTAELVTSNLKDLESFVRRLQSAPRPFDRWLLEQLPSPLQQAVNAHRKGHPHSQRLKQKLIDRLNELLSGGLIHEPARFATIELRPRSKELLAKSPAGRELQQLNRWLLEDACPDEISKVQVTDLQRLISKSDPIEAGPLSISDARKRFDRAWDAMCPLFAAIDRLGTEPGTKPSPPPSQSAG